MRRLLIYWAYTSLAGLALSTRVVVHAVRSFVLSCSPFRCWPGNDKNKCKNVISTKDDLYRDKKKVSKEFTHELSTPPSESGSPMRSRAF